MKLRFIAENLGNDTANLRIQEENTPGASILLSGIRLSNAIEYTIELAKCYGTQAPKPAVCPASPLPCLITDFCDIPVSDHSELVALVSTTLKIPSMKTDPESKPVTRLTFIEDAFGVNRLAAFQIVEHLLEAWTPERKDRIIKSMTAREAEFIEHIVIGDYDLTLWRYRKLNEYGISLNSGQEDLTTLSGQKKHPKAQQIRWYDVVTQLQLWVNTYGRLLVGSTVKDRTDQYRRLLTRHFLTAEWSEHPNAGFFLMPD